MPMTDIRMTADAGHLGGDFARLVSFAVQRMRVNGFDDLLMAIPAGKLGHLPNLRRADDWLGKVTRGERQ